MEKKEKKTGRTAYIIGAECVYVILGLILLFVPQIQLPHICYGISATMVFAGILLIVRYFLTESFRNLNEYGFSVGMLFVILGMCALVRVQQWVPSFIPVLGIALLFMTIIKLQYAVDLKSMKDPVWIVVLVIAILLIAGAVCVVINPFKEDATRQYVTYGLLIVDGALGILENIYLFVRLSLYRRGERKAMESKENSEGNAIQASGELPVEEIEEKE